MKLRGRFLEVFGCTNKLVGGNLPFQSGSRTFLGINGPELHPLVTGPLVKPCHPLSATQSISDHLSVEERVFQAPLEALRWTRLNAILCEAARIISTRTTCAVNSSSCKRAKEWSARTRPVSQPAFCITNSLNTSICLFVSCFCRLSLCG